MADLKIAIDFEALFLVQKAFVAYNREMHASSVQYSEIRFGDPSLSYKLTGREFQLRRNDFFRPLYARLIHIAPGAMEIVSLLRQLPHNDIIIVTDYPDTYIDVIRWCLNQHFTGWRPAIFCNKIPLCELTHNESLQNINILDFLEKNAVLSREIGEQEYISKAQICACLNIDAVIDTNPVTAQDMGFMGIDVSMVERPWNKIQKPRLVRKIETWQEIIVQIRILAQEKK